MIRLSSLGECVIDVDGTRIGPQQELLFGIAVFLLLERRRGLTKAEIIRHIWDDADSPAALHRLRQALYKLRGLGVQLVTEKGIVRIADHKVHVDFEHLADLSGGRAPDAIDARLAGPFLAGFDPSLGHTFERWLEEKRDMVRTLCLRALLDRIRVHRTRGDWKTASLWARQCLALDPLNEEATLVLAEATALLGNKVRAVRVLEEYLDEVGDGRTDLAIPARTLRRRIGQLPDDTGTGDSRIPIQGRSSELTTLDGHLQGALTGRGGIVLVTGDEGIGKTRLCREFVRYAGLTSVWAAELTCTITDRARPFSSFADLVPRLLAAPGALGVAPTTISSLALLTEGGSSQNGNQPGQPELVGAQIRASLTDLIGSVAAEKTILILIDDVHWLDRDSWRLLRELRTWIGSHRVLIVLSGRPSRKLHALAGIQAGTGVHLQLRPLDRASSLALVSTIVEARGDTMSANVREWIANTSGGVPLLLLELVRHGAPVSPQESLPRSYIELLSRRLDQLSAPALYTLQVVSLLDGHCTLSRLEALLTPGEGFAESLSIMTCLRELDHHDLLTWSHGIVTVANRLIGEAAVAQLSPLLKAALHHRIATLLEKSMQEEDGGPALWACAEHWRHAGDTQRSIALLRSCARRALAVGGAADAADMLQEALATRPQAHERLPMLIELSHALQLAGQMKQALPIYATIRQLRSAANKGRDTVHDDIELASFQARWKGGDCLSELFAQLRQCVLCNAAPPLHRVRAATLAIMFADNLFDGPGADEIGSVVKTLPLGDNLDGLEYTYFSMLFESVRGDVGTAARKARKLLALAMTEVEETGLPKLFCNVGRTLVAAGFGEEGQALFERAFQTGLRLQLPAAAGSAAYALQNLYLSRGDVEVSNQWARECERHVGELWCENDITRANYFSALCRAAILRRAYDLAEEHVARANALTRSNASARGALYHSTLSLRIKHERDSYIAGEGELQELVSIHTTARAFGSQDFQTETISLALARAGRGDEARHLLHEYLTTHRRERTPVPELLRSLHRSSGD